MRAVETLSFALIGLAFAACATSASTAQKSKTPTALQEHHVQMEPVRFATSPTGEVVVTDPQTLFDRASRLYSDGKYDDAATSFNELLHDFAESRLATPARYNLGLTYEKLAKPELALDAYRQLPRDVDARYRHASLLTELNRWRDADADWGEILDGKTLPELTLSDRIQAMAQRGSVRLKLDDLDGAEKILRAAMTLYKAHQLEERLDSDYFLAMAAYRLAEVSHRQFRLLPIRLPESRMKEDLELKAQMLLLAQKRYLDAMQVNHVEWAVAAGYQIGALYREMYDAFLTAPVPQEAKGELRDVYLEQLKKRVRPLLEKAVTIFEKNIAMAERAGFRGNAPGEAITATGVDGTAINWKERSEAELGALQALLLPGAPAHSTAPPDPSTLTPAEPAPKPAPAQPLPDRENAPGRM